MVAEFFKGENFPRVLGTGISESKGVRHGYIANIDDAIKSIRRAVHEAEKNSGVKIKKAIVSIGGISLSSEIGYGSAIISKADGEVTVLDVNKAIAESENNLQILNKKIIHTIPIQYKLDGKEIHGRPEGMRGIKLEIRTLFITTLEQHLDDLLMAISQCDIEVLDIIASPFAESLIVMSEKQKAAGCILANIGAETVSLAVFENGNIVSLHVFSIGSTDITNDIALGLKIPLEEAEAVKTGLLVKDYSKKKLDQIIEARLTDIFELIENHLKKIKRNGLLPAGIIFTGGGSSNALIQDLAREILKIPTKAVHPDMYSFTKGKIKNSAWFVALGLCAAGKDSLVPSSSYSSIKRVFQNAKNFFTNIGKQLLP